LRYEKGHIVGVYHGCFSSGPAVRSSAEAEEEVTAGKGVKKEITLENMEAEIEKIEKELEQEISEEQ
jgi:hypothetical protein